MIELLAGCARAQVLPAAGGRIGALVVDDTELLVTGDASEPPTLWGCFPMAPWVGRIRDGRFTHDGITHQLAVNLPPHAIHGTVYASRWERTDDGTDPTCTALTSPLGDAWPFGGTAAQRISLTTDALTCTLSITAGDRTMPAELGWHPWFATRAPAELDADAMYERDATGIPTGKLVAPSPRPWNDCFRTTRPVRLRVGPLDVIVDSDCDHVVLFEELDIGTAVEPQSGPPDAANLAPRVLAPGTSLERTMTITWHRGLPTRG